VAIYDIRMLSDLFLSSEIYNILNNIISGIFLIPYKMLLRWFCFFFFFSYPSLRKKYLITYLHF